MIFANSDTAMTLISYSLVALIALFFLACLIGLAMCVRLFVILAKDMKR